MHVDSINALTLAVSFTNNLLEQFSVGEIIMLGVMRGKHSRTLIPLSSAALGLQLFHHGSATLHTF